MKNIPWPALWVELIGTLFLTLAIGLALGTVSTWTPLVAGGALAALVYLGRPVQAGHYNPAVTLGVMIHGKISPQNAAWYLLAQILGAIAGAGLVIGLVQDSSFTYSFLPAGSATLVQILLAEVLFTFLLVWGYLHTVQHPTSQLTGFHGIAMGMLYIVAWISIRGVSGAVLNPALGSGVNLLSQDFEPIWIFWVAPLMGGTLGGFTYRLTAPQDIPKPLKEYLPKKEEAPQDSKPEEQQKPKGPWAAEGEKKSPQ